MHSVKTKWFHTACIHKRFRVASACFGCILLVSAIAGAQTINYKIATGDPKLTYFKIGQDLATFIAPSAQIHLTPVPTKGSVENVRQMRYAKGVKFALVQHDVYQRYLDFSKTNPKAAELILPLRVILPLYFEELHLLVRKDSPMNEVKDIMGKRINLGSVGSGTAMTTSIVYEMLFHKPIPAQNITNLSFTEALKKLVKNETDVVSIVAGQPTKLLTSFSDKAANIVKLLTVNSSDPVYAQALENYYLTTIRSANYGWLKQDLPCFGVKAFLITYNYPQPHNQRYLHNFAYSLARNFDKLLQYGHPKWKEVDTRLEDLPGKWKYYPVTYQALCKSGIFTCPRSPGQAPGNDEECTQEMRLLGICQ